MRLPATVFFTHLPQVPYTQSHQLHSCSPMYLMPRRPYQSASQPPPSRTRTRSTQGPRLGFLRRNAVPAGRFGFLCSTDVTTFEQRVTRRKRMGEPSREHISGQGGAGAGARWRRRRKRQRSCWIVTRGGEGDGEREGREGQNAMGSSGGSWGILN